MSTPGHARFNGDEAGNVLCDIHRQIECARTTKMRFARLHTREYTQDVSVPAPRGIIYDRNGYVLARNIASYTVVITPADLPDDEADIQNVYRELSALRRNWSALYIEAIGPVQNARGQQRVWRRVRAPKN